MGNITQTASPTIDPTVLSHHLNEIVRGDSDDLSSYLHEVESHKEIDGTKATTHCYTVIIDSNGSVNVSDLIDLMIEHATMHAIPRSRIAAAFNASNGKNTKHTTRLQKEAEALFTNLANSGEGGELLLFMMAEFVLGIPQILCKMDLKTSYNHHYNGSDGVHAQVDPSTGELLLWWGESKLYANATSAVTECFKSLAPYLIEPNTPQAARKRDMLLLRDKLDLNDENLEAALKRYFDRDKKESRKVRYCGFALVGFTSEAYPADAKAVNEEVVDAVKLNLGNWRQHIGKRIGEESLSDFEMHVVCVPFPCVDAFRRLLLARLGLTPSDQKTMTETSGGN